MASKILKALKNVRDALFPLNITCDLCGREIFSGDNLCEECKKSVDFIGENCCKVCGRKTAKPEICLECKAEAPLFKRGVCALNYTGGGAALVLKFKKGAPYLAKYLGGLVAEKVKSLPKCDAVVYVPVTPKRLKQRGYNQSLLLAEEIAERLNLPVLHALIKSGETPDQKSLSKRERAENLGGCFKLEKNCDIKGKRLLLVDDVMTTGATAERACERLLKGGANEVYFAAVASVEYNSK